MNLYTTNTQAAVACWYNQCRQPALSARHRSCRFHYVQRFFARQFLYSKSKGAVDALLAQFDKQDGKCFYTGRPLTIGENAVVVWRWPDHVSRDEQIAMRPWEKRARYVVWACPEAATLRRQFMHESDFEQMIMDLALVLQKNMLGD